MAEIKSPFLDDYGDNEVSSTKQAEEESIFEKKTSHPKIDKEEVWHEEDGDNIVELKDKDGVLRKIIIILVVLLSLLLLALAAYIFFQKNQGINNGLVGKEKIEKNTNNSFEMESLKYKASSITVN
jgi:hypothetical protein